MFFYAHFLTYIQRSKNECCVALKLVFYAHFLTYIHNLLLNYFQIINTFFSKKFRLIYSHIHIPKSGHVPLQLMGSSKEDVNKLGHTSEGVDFCKIISKRIQLCAFFGKTLQSQSFSETVGFPELWIHYTLPKHAKAHPRLESSVVPPARYDLLSTRKFNKAAS